MISFPLHDRRPGVVLLYASALAVAALAFLPIIYLIHRTAGAGSEAWGLLVRPTVWAVLGRSVLLAAITTSASLVIGVPLAWLTSRTDLPFKRFWSVAAILPLAMPSYVMAYAFIALLGPKGALANWLGVFGVERLPDFYGLPATSAVITLINYPYITLSARAALQRLDPALEEAAQGLGVSRGQIFRRVILPQLRPALAAGGLLVALYTLSDFGAPALLQYRSFTQVIFVEYNSFDRTSAALLALVLVVLTVILLSAEAATRGRGGYHRVTPAAQRPPRLSRLGRWKTPALLFCGLMLFLSVVLPVLVLISWIVAGIARGNEVSFGFAMIRNSTFAAFLAALAATLAALPVVYLSVRRAGPLTFVMERLAYAGNALPGIVIALALVFFSKYAPAWLYQSLPLLIFAYVVRFLPQAAGSLRMSLLQLNPRIEEAAVSLGRSRASVFFRVTLPMLAPGLLAGGTLVFLSTLKELPITLMLHPTGFDTLVEEIWWTTSQVRYSQAALPALLLVCVSALSIAIILRQEKRGAYA